MDAERKQRDGSAGGWLLSAGNGSAGKRFYLAFWIPVLYVIWSACLVMAARACPGYAMANHDISDLGDPAMNPEGWWLWSIGMGIAGLMIYPPMAYASRRMEALTVGQAEGERRLVESGSMALRCGCLGMLGLALVPQSIKLDWIHVISGVFAFGGVYVTLLFLWGIVLFKMPEMHGARWVLFLVSAWWAVVGFLATQGFRFFAYGEVGHDVKHRGESVLLRFSLWEWMLFAALMTSFAMFIALLPPKGTK